MPYSTVNLGIRTTVSEAILALTWGAILWHSFLSSLPQAPSLTRRPTDQMLLWLMLFSAFPFMVGQVITHADSSGLANWLRWLLNLSGVFLAAKLLVDQKHRESLGDRTVARHPGDVGVVHRGVRAHTLRGRDRADSWPVQLRQFRHAQIWSGGHVFAHGLAVDAPECHRWIMALLLPLAFCFGMTEQGWKRALGLGVACLGAAASLLASSRGAMVSLALVLIWMASRRVPYTGRLLMIGAALTIALVMADPPFAGSPGDDFFLRTTPVPKCVSMNTACPPQAVGGLSAGHRLQRSTRQCRALALLGISNLWLTYIYKIGLVGMLLFVAVTVRWWREARPEKGPIRLTKDNALWLGTTAGILSALVSGLFDHYFSFAVVMVALFWLMVGINALEARRLFPARLPQVKTVTYRKPLFSGARP